MRARSGNVGVDGVLAQSDHLRSGDDALISATPLALFCFPFGGEYRRVWHERPTSYCKDGQTFSALRDVPQLVSAFFAPSGNSASRHGCLGQAVRRFVQISDLGQFAQFCADISQPKKDYV